MLNITNYQKNANQNHNEIPPHICQNGITKITGDGKDVGKREPLCPVGGNGNCCSHYRKQYEDSTKILKIELTCDLAIPLLGSTFQIKQKC